MKLGLLTAALSDLSLEEVARWSHDNGFDALEIACWPAGGGAGRRYAGVSHIDVDSFDAAAVRELLTSHGLETEYKSLLPTLYAAVIDALLAAANSFGPE